MRTYYLRLIKTAFSRSLGQIDLWTGAFASILGLVDHYLPQANIMTSYAWMIPVWALALVMLVRLLLAPYWMWKGDRAESDAQAQEIADLKGRLEPSVAIEFGIGYPFRERVSDARGSPLDVYRVRITNRGGHTADRCAVVVHRVTLKSGRECTTTTFDLWCKQHRSGEFALSPGGEAIFEVLAVGEHEVIFAQRGLQWINIEGRDNDARIPKEAAFIVLRVLSDGPPQDLSLSFDRVGDGDYVLEAANVTRQVSEP
jgi:hypothetical protein